MITLWDLLTAVCFAMPFGGALASAKLGKVGFNGYFLAIAIGAAVGVCFAWTMRTVGETVATRTKGQPVATRERYARALYLTAILWIILGLFLGGWVSSTAMKLVF